jgi:hypothetical protein
MTVPFIRKSTQRNSSWPGDLNLQQQAEYICADLSFDPSLFPLQSGGGPYILGKFDGKLAVRAKERNLKIVVA